jgi:hypothetical protein
MTVTCLAAARPSAGINTSVERMLRRVFFMEGRLSEASTLS